MIKHTDRSLHPEMLRQTKQEVILMVEEAIFVRQPSLGYWVGKHSFRILHFIGPQIYCMCYEILQASLMALSYCTGKVRMHKFRQLISGKLQQTDKFAIVIVRSMFKLVNSHTGKQTRVKAALIGSLTVNVGLETSSRVVYGFLYFPTHEYIYKIDVLRGNPRLAGRISNTGRSLNFESVRINLKDEKILAVQTREPIERVFTLYRLFWLGLSGASAAQPAKFKVKLETGQDFRVSFESMILNKQETSLNIWCRGRLDYNLDKPDEDISVTVTVTATRKALSAKSTLRFSTARTERPQESQFHYILISVDLASLAMRYQVITSKLTLALSGVSSKCLAFCHTINEKAEASKVETLGRFVYAQPEMLVYDIGKPDQFHCLLTIENRLQELSAYSHVELPAKESSVGMSLHFVNRQSTEFT